MSGQTHIQGLPPEDPDRVEADGLSAGQRRTIRRKELLESGVHPATGLPLAGNGETCGTCANMLVRSHNMRRYHKCVLAGVTRGAGTDIRVSWPACTSWEVAA